MVAATRPVEFVDADRIGFGNLTYDWTQADNPHPRLHGVPIWAFKG